MLTSGLANSCEFGLFMMEKRTFIMPATSSFGLFILLLLATCSGPTARPAGAASNVLYYNLSNLTLHPPQNVFSPLLKALSDHLDAKWSQGLWKKIKPEYKYIKYLKEVYKRPSRWQRTVEGKNVYNTVRLMKPQDHYLAPQKNKGTFIQTVSYSLDQVRTKEELLKSTLLYSLDRGRAWSVSSVCYLSITEQEPSSHCGLCPQCSVHHSVNFTGRQSGRNWVEIDVTMFLLPFLKFQKNNLHLLINVTCPEDQVDTRNTLELMLGSPPLLLYLSDTGAVDHQRSLVNNNAAQKTSTTGDKLQEDMFKTKPKTGHKKRMIRSVQNSNRDESLKRLLPELRSGSEFPTSDCALYDFKVRFSKLQLDNWIVFPRKYNPRYCRGSCTMPVGFLYDSPIHTMVQNVIYENLDSSVPRASCVPSHYIPMSVLMIEKDRSYVYKEFEDMVATGCTCR